MGCRKVQEKCETESHKQSGNLSLVTIEPKNIMISSVEEFELAKPKEKASCGTSCLQKFLVAVTIILVICTFPFSLVYCVKIVREYERAVLFRLGRLKKKETVGPGLFFILPCLDEVCNLCRMNFKKKKTLKN